VLTSGGYETPPNADVLAALSTTGNVTLIERPVRAATLLSAILASLRARHRQYDMRDLLAEERRAKEALTQSEKRLHIALDAARLGAWQRSSEGEQLQCTSLHKANFGLAADAPFSYSDMLAAIHPDDRSKKIEAIRAT
jgi:PAS domain-containing protein